MPKLRNWKMPAWMEPYRDLIWGNGEPIEDLVRDESPWQTNAIRAIIAATVKGQVGLLVRLHMRGALSSEFDNPHEPEDYAQDLDSHIDPADPM